MGKARVIEKDGLKLIVTYSDSRAKKDSQNREKGLQKVRKADKDRKADQVKYQQPWI